VREINDPSAAAGSAPDVADRLHRAGERRYWCHRVGGATAQVAFDDDERHHLRNVMRLREGAQVEAIDGSGAVFTIRLATEGRHLVGEVIAERHDPPLPAASITLALGLARPARFAWAVEKAAELGVLGVRPLITEHARVNERFGASKLRRWRRIARVATLQSLGSKVPEVHAPMNIVDLDVGEFGACWVAHGPGAQRVPGRRPDGQLLIVVGPEGGLTDAEVARLEAEGAERLVLGVRRLRAETAAIAAVSIAAWGADRSAG